MRVSSYIGRIGGLAVALGIGAAASGGVAWAVPEDASSASSAEAAEGTPSSASDSRAGRGSRASRTAPAPVSAASVAAPDAGMPARSDRRSAGRLPVPAAASPRKNAAPSAADTAAPPAKPVIAPGRGTEDRSPVAQAPVPAAATAVLDPAPSVSSPASAGPVVQSITATRAAPVMTPAPPPAAAQPAVGGVVESVLSPLFGSDPTAPIESPMSWAVLAVARRDGVQARTLAAPAATVSTAQRIAPLAAATATATNQAPVISSVTVTAPNATTGAVTGTVKATDPNGDTMTYKAATSSKGTVAITTAGVFTYTPTATARHAAAKVDATTSTTTDTVTVTVTDAKGLATSQAVTVTISPKNTAPTATKTVGTPNTTTGVVTGTVTGTDADKDVLTYSGSTTTGKGTVVVTANTGAYTYTPTATARHAAAKIGAPSADKADTFTITVTDGYGGSVAVPVTVTVSPRNTAPVAGTSTVGTPDSNTGVVTGTVGATDADSDALTYTAPATTSKGSVTLNSGTGAFTYTPTTTARDTAARTPDKTDTFTVTVTDGYGGSTAVPVVVPISPKALPNAVTFTFNYRTGSQYWTPESRAALETAASTLAAYLVVDKPITVVFDVTADKNTSRTLATATSNLTSTNAGFYGTVVQNKILTGVDPNGATVDGTISVNFGMPWGFTDSVSKSQYDFTSTAMHEIMHTLGFISFVDAAGKNTRTNWTKYDSFIVNSSKTRVIGSNYKWNTTFNTNLTGGNGGLYFNGPNAVAAYGDLVPLYTPNPWASGSSVNHLRDSAFTGMNLKMMNAMVNTGLGIRVLSAVELGVLKDLGYTVIPVQGGAAALLVSFLLLRRRKA